MFHPRRRRRSLLNMATVLGVALFHDVRADQPPVIVAPDSVTVRAGLQLNVDVTAHDPDGDPITSLVMEGLPEAKFVGSLSNTTGWLAWTPQVADMGLHTVTFTASNSLSGSATTVIRVSPPPIPPIVVLSATPVAGLGPLEVTLDASGSYDSDGTIVLYQFLFGDGTTAVNQTSPIAVHTYAGGGTYQPTVRAWDDEGAMGSGVTSVRADRRPVAEFYPDRLTGLAPLGVQFGAYRSYDPDGGTIVRYAWDFGDGATAVNGDSYALHYYAEGTWAVTLTVTNALGNTGTSAPTTITVGPENHPPDVTSPSFVVGEAGQPMTIHVSAVDPDGDPIVALVTWGAPPASTMQQSADHSSADFHWTPAVADVGSRKFYFDAVTNRGDWYVPVIVAVWSSGLPPNRASNSSFETDVNGWNSYAGATLERIPGGHAGSFGLQVTGPAVLNGSFGVNDSPDVVHHTLQAGLSYRYTAWVRSATSHGKAKLRIREYRMSNGELVGETTSAGVTLTPDWQMLTVDYVTKAEDSTLDFQIRDFPLAASEVFETDEIGVYEVTGQPGTLVGVPDTPSTPDVRPRLSPSPVRTFATLSFATARRGSVRVDLLDLAGRRVRRLLDEPDAPAGSFALPIRSGEGGPKLAPGVYFYRVDAAGVRTIGRFVLLQ